jgi:hypothetical protein
MIEKVRSVVRNVDFARELVPPGDHEQPAERDVLADHEAEFRDFGVFEVLAKFRFESRVYAAKVRCELLCEANRERIPRLELTLWLG